MKSTLTLADLEAAINDWRRHAPATGDEFTLSPQVAALAVPYAWMILHHSRTLDEGALSAAARQALDAWRQRCDVGRS